MSLLDPLSVEHDDGTVFRDVIMLALAGFIAIVILLLPHLNPPGVAKEGADAPGNVIVELKWEDALDIDVDLWVEAPGDRPVGYSNKGGQIFNLLRDDLGRRADVTDLNYEVSYSRGIPAGEYTVNVHLYRATASPLPIPVQVVASVKKGPERAPRRIVAAEVELSRQGEEATAFRFKLTEKGDLVAGSVHRLPKALRNAKR